ncbi:hypothetical protein [Bacillus tuaregi]|uniref:hypothetical protein n=1 Tax=Bacillus tuaregi TaxID=1816695 RepID=UPI0008F862C0|nr:hypothetical protein [Bacillus tuaregi]
MSQNEQDKKQKQKKIQGLYRKTKQQRRENTDYMYDYSGMDDSGDNKIGKIVVSICVVLGIIVIILNAFIKEF